MAPSTDRERALAFLRERGVQRHLHHGRPLLAHLEGTESILRTWGAPPPLTMAGLCHAIYGTDGLAEPLVPVPDRHLVRDAFGAAVEAIVYLYASCDRLFLYPQLGRVETLEFKDRFSGEVLRPDDAAIRSFMELTWANSIDALRVLPHSHRRPVEQLFAATSSMVSHGAWMQARQELGFVFGPEPHVCGEG